MHHVAPEALSPRRRRKREARTERILETAMGLLGREGLAALTIHRVASELDYTVGALYRYFSSKDSLLAELERRVVVRFGQLLGDAADRAIRHATARRAAPGVAALVPLIAVGDAYQRLPRAMPEQFTLVSHDLGNPTQIMSAEDDARVAAELIPIVDGVAAWFRGAARAKALTAGDADQRAMVFWAGIHGASQLQKLVRLPALAVPGRLGADTTRALLAGWGATAVRLTRARELVDQALASPSPTREVSS